MASKLCWKTISNKFGSSFEILVCLTAYVSILILFKFNKAMGSQKKNKKVQ